MFNRIRVSILAATLGAALLAVTAVPQLGASEFDNKTIVSFSSPVEISGQLLPAGTYVFKTLGNNREIVEVMNLAQNHLYGAFQANHIDAPAVPVEARIELSEGNGNSPEAVHAWFYPGASQGWEFPASKNRKQAAAERAD